MASWTAPNTSWTPGNGIAFTDLNRIEENTLYLKDNQDQIIEITRRVQGFNTYIRKEAGPAYDSAFLLLFSLFLFWL